MYSRLKAFTIIAVATVLVSGSVYFFLFVSSSLSIKDAHKITKIVSPLEEAVTPSLLAEKLSLAVDHPTGMQAFDSEKGKNLLLATLVFSDATFVKLKPETLFIDYTLRTPLGYVGDLTNTFVDRDGVLFPAFPYFTPKKVPEIFFGIPPLKEYWGRRLSGKKMQIVCELLELLKETSVTKIDVSELDEPTLGRRELVVILSVRGKERILRLHAGEYALQLKNYFALDKAVLSKENVSCVIDLRIPNLAYIERGKS